MSNSPTGWVVLGGARSGWSSYVPSHFGPRLAPPAGHSTEGIKRKPAGVTLRIEETIRRSLNLLDGETFSAMTQDNPRVAVVTGASRGIGQATAQRLAADGFLVVLAARRAETLSLVADAINRWPGRAVAVPTDLVGPRLHPTALVEVVVERIREDRRGGEQRRRPPRPAVRAASRDEWQDVLDLNLTGPVHLATRSKPHMRAGGVVVTCRAQRPLPVRGLVHYNTAKAALVMATGPWPWNGLATVCGCSPFAPARSIPIW